MKKKKTWFYRTGIYCLLLSILGPVYASAQENESEMRQVDSIYIEHQGNEGLLVPTHPIIESVESEINLLNMRSVNSQQQEFIDKLAVHAPQLADANDMYASVMMAQAILESGWGSSALASEPNHNLFGIKGEYYGEYVLMNTSEYIKETDEWVIIPAKFRKYPSYLESLQDNVHVIKQTSFIPGIFYYSGAWKSNTNSYKDATEYLTGRYATDPQYGDKLNKLIEEYGLTQYDTDIKMHRLYNRNTGEHFYTTKEIEKDNLMKKNWYYEGIAWYSPHSGEAVYRLLNPNSGEHHYTQNINEKNNLIAKGWKDEGTGWYSGGIQAVYRLYNPNVQTGSHHYTLHVDEKNNLVAKGWKDEGIAWYAN